MGKKNSLNNLSWKFAGTILNVNKIILDNLVVVRLGWEFTTINEERDQS